MLKRYTHLRSEDLHRVKPRMQPPSIEILVGPTPAQIAIDAMALNEESAEQGTALMLTAQAAGTKQNLGDVPHSACETDRKMSQNLHPV